jgi:autotransporter-associated beta strand protein
LNDGALVSSDGGTTRSIANTQINLLGNVTFNQGTGGTGRIQMAGSWDLGGAARIITVNRPTISFGSGQEGLAVTTPTGFTAPRFQNGSLTIATTTGTATNPAIFRFTTSAFSSNGALTIDDGVAISSQNGSFFAAGADAPALTLAAAVSKGGGILQLGDGVLGGVATTRSAIVYSLNGGGTVTASNTTGTTSTGTLTVNNGNGAEFSGNISQGGTGVIAFTKSGAGSQTLSGTNSYTGKTTISGGMLRFAKQVSLYNNNNLTSWTDTNIQVDSAAVLALNVGGTGEFTSTDIATLAALGTATGGFKNGSRLGLDTTNAGGSFTYSNVLANPGANALGLRKLGTGTLVLDQVNTYTGGTIVEGGTLKIVKPGGIHTGSLVLNPGTSFDADFSALVAAGQVTNATTGSGTILATPPNATQLSFTSGTLTGFAGTINVKPSPASSGRVDFNGLIGTGSTLNIDSGATARLASVSTYSGVTINVSGTGGSGPGALRLESGTLDSLCAVNLLSNTSIGSFSPAVSTIEAIIADGGNGFSLAKAGDSTLVLNATNTYTGDTNINGGTLRISKPYLADSSDIFIAATAVLHLNFDETSTQVSDTVSTLTIGTTQMAAGTYGATGSGAANIDDDHFLGGGTLTVLNGPSVSNNYESWASNNTITGGPNGDSDNDGVSNLVEYALVDGGERGSYVGDTITFSKRGAPYGTDITYAIETSETLAAGSWTVAVNGGSPSEIAYSFTPGTPLKKFARLKVVKIP